jgi:hypothetical protein
MTTVRGYQYGNARNEPNPMLASFRYASSNGACIYPDDSLLERALYIGVQSCRLRQPRVPLACHIVINVPRAPQYYMGDIGSWCGNRGYGNRSSSWNLKTRKAVWLFDGINYKFIGHWFPRSKTFLMIYLTDSRIIKNWFFSLWPLIATALGLSYTEVAPPVEQQHAVAITVGADPEFELIDENETAVRADRVIRGDYWTAELGVDGSGQPVEMRPRYGNPEDVVESLKSIIERFTAEYPGYDLSPVGDTFACGGHIHFGVRLDGVRPHDLSLGDVCTILDAFLGRDLLALSGDARYSYRRLGAARTNDHGFEYRTPPAWAFANPDITRVTLAIAKGLVTTYFKYPAIVFNEPPTLEEYVQWGDVSEEDATYFMSFVQQPVDHRASLLAYWSVPKNQLAPIPEDAPHIRFEDIWNEQVRLSLLASILEAWDNLIERAQRTVALYTLVIYGLAGSRGTRGCTFSSSNLNWLRNPRDFQVGTELNFGVSFDVRNGEYNTSLSALGSDLIDVAYSALSDR